MAVNPDSFGPTSPGRDKALQIVVARAERAEAEVEALGEQLRETTRQRDEAQAENAKWQKRIVEDGWDMVIQESEEFASLRARLRALVAQWEDTATRLPIIDKHSLIEQQEHDTITQLFRRCSKELAALLADGPAPQAPQR